MSIGTCIAERRKQLKMTQHMLAEAVDVSFQAVSAWERNECLPDTERLSKIAKALQISVSCLMEEEAPAEGWELLDRLFSESKMYSFVKVTAAAKKMPLTGKALVMMERCHRGQYRKGKDSVPYINHPLTMACHALALGIEEDAMIAAILLHDVVEDCGITPDELDTSEEVREAVVLLTFVQEQGQTRMDAKEQYFKRISGNRIALIVKLLDRCNNISTMVTGFDKAKMISYIRETESMVMPLLDQVKHECPEYYNTAFLLKYQMKSVLETIKRLL